MLFPADIAVHEFNVCGYPRLGGTLGLGQHDLYLFCPKRNKGSFGVEVELWAVRLGFFSGRGRSGVVNE
jgi:hypothetical protein